jgi:hypothetical protein
MIDDFKRRLNSFLTLPTLQEPALGRKHGFKCRLVRQIMPVDLGSFGL